MKHKKIVPQTLVHVAITVAAVTVALAVVRYQTSSRLSEPSLAGRSPLSELLIVTTRGKLPPTVPRSTERWSAGRLFFAHWLYESGIRYGWPAAIIANQRQLEYCGEAQLFPPDEDRTQIALATSAGRVFVLLLGTWGEVVETVEISSFESPDAGNFRRLGLRSSRESGVVQIEVLLLDDSSNPIGLRAKFAQIGRPVIYRVRHNDSLQAFRAGPEQAVLCTVAVTDQLTVSIARRATQVDADLRVPARSWIDTVQRDYQAGYRQLWIARHARSKSARGRHLELARAHLRAALGACESPTDLKSAIVSALRRVEECEASTDFEKPRIGAVGS